MKFLQPEGWKPAKGYANGILSRDGTLHVGGQIGWTGDQVFESHDFAGQMIRTHSCHIWGLTPKLSRMPRRRVAQGYPHDG